ncbi:hypothetical protein GCM10009789_18250 [Kribbella sancticallisti]|uniref:Colicin import membrane protein n=1 Tax=Kribbella sancticallisti TaxID=460087 RepID=A0ABN2CXP1_9ACTN
MADTDDEQTAELGPDDRAKGEDEGAPGAEAAGEDRRAKEWEAGADQDGAALAAGLTEDEEEAAERVERKQQRLREEIEQDAREERELADSRYRHDVNQANADIAKAMRLAEIAEGNRNDLRREAAGERRLARNDTAHAAHLRAGAAGRDDPQAEADRSAADRAQASANYQDRIANYDDSKADWYDAESRAQRREAAQVRRPEQPPAAEAVRTPPKEAPRARKNLKQQRRRKTKELRDFGLGE